MENIYTHGGDVYRNKVKYDFSVNINPLGMPKKSIEAGKRAIELSQQYPDYRGEELCRRLSEKEGCNAENIILGNGAAELIYALCQSERPKKALIPVPAFKEYENAVMASGGEVIKLYSKEENNFEIYAESLISEIHAHKEGDIDLLFLCNPNNPTGQMLDREEICLIAESCEDRKIRLVVDECFLPFCDCEEKATMKRELERFKHMCVLRAFTKIYAMPGLRLGYLITADSGLKGRISEALQPWNTSIPAQMAGCAALEDEDYIIRTRRLIYEEREYIFNEISALEGVSAYKSNANFILFSIDSGLSLYDILLGCGIMIRKCDDFDGLTADSGKQYYRVAVRTHSENEQLVKAMREVL